MKLSVVELRLLRDSDAARIRELHSDRRMMEYQETGYPLSKDFGIRVVREARSGRRSKSLFDFAIIEAKTGELAGMIGLWNIDYERDNAEIGYWLGVRYWNRGLATGAVAKVLELAFGQMKLKRVHAIVFEGNEASERVLVKNGFVFEGVTRQGFKKGRRYLTSRNYGILREEWRP